MKILLIIFLLLKFVPVFCQVQQINDSVAVMEDKSFDAGLDGAMTYTLKIFFTGNYANDTVEICYNNKRIYNRILTKGEIESSERLTIVQSDLEVQIKKTKKNDLVFYFNGKKIQIPFRRGYSMLHINTWLKSIDGKYKMNYDFSYTNNFQRGI